MAGNQQELEETRKDPPLEPSEGSRPCNTLILDFWPLES